MVADAYNGVKSWMHKRFTKDENASAVYVTIYDPDGKPLKSVLGRGVDHIRDLTPIRDDDQRT